MRNLIASTGVGPVNHLVSIFILFNEVGQDIKLIPLGSSKVSMKNLSDARQRGLIIRFGTNRFNIGHFYTSLTFIESYPAWVSTKHM